eukprot:m.18926 g.18926  ORF g.18926 m.18926 type:complete len:422 (+) comp27753_c0_seq2:115-1380(+)
MTVVNSSIVGHESVFCLFAWIAAVVWFCQPSEGASIPPLADLRLSLTLCEKVKRGTGTCPGVGSDFNPFQIRKYQQKKWRDGKPLVGVFRQWKPDFIKSPNCSYHIALEECYLQNELRKYYPERVLYRAHLIKKGCPVSDSFTHLPNRRFLTTCLNSNTSLAFRIRLTKQLAKPAIVPPFGHAFSLECKAILCSPQQEKDGLPKCPSYNRKRNNCSEIKYAASTEQPVRQTLSSGRIYLAVKKSKKPEPSKLPTTLTPSSDRFPTEPQEKATSAGPTSPSVSKNETEILSTQETRQETENPTTPQATTREREISATTEMARQRETLKIGTKIQEPTRRKEMPKTSESKLETKTPEAPSSQRQEKTRGRSDSGALVGLTCSSSVLLIAGTAVLVFLIVRRHRNVIVAQEANNTKIEDGSQTS